LKNISAKKSKRTQRTKEFKLFGINGIKKKARTAYESKLARIRNLH